MLKKQPFNILIVEDDAGIAEMLRFFFVSQGMIAAVASDGKQALEILPSFQPDIIILDIILPYLDGLSVLDRLRTDAISTPVILLTEKNTVEEKLQGFDFGADDYVTKPFSLRELLARIHAVIRRHRSSNSPGEHQPISLGPLTINPMQREATLSDGTALPLTKTEFNLLYFFAEKINQVVPHSVILKTILGYDPDSQTKALVMHIANIRKKLKSQDITTLQLKAVPGIGYKLIDCSATAETPGNYPS
jgi:DNA-binding response OmpR family regulator